jgi:hypothetical protein
MLTKLKELFSTTVLPAPLLSYLFLKSAPAIDMLLRGYEIENRIGTGWKEKGWVHFQLKGLGLFPS